LVEAMAFKRPIIARDFAAIPETMDGAGVLLPDASGPIMLAEALAEVIEDSALARSLTQRSAAGATRFDGEAARQTFLRHLAAAI
jgi:glycosyltransferase involved in cell wall biosynthesis